MRKVQLSITDQEEEILRLKAESLGFNVTKFIKFLVSQEAYTIAQDLSTFSLSEKSENEVLRAMEEHKKGKSIKLSKIDDLDRL